MRVVRNAIQFLTNTNIRDSTKIEYEQTPLITTMS